MMFDFLSARKRRHVPEAAPDPVQTPPAPAAHEPAAISATPAPQPRQLTPQVGVDVGVDVALTALVQQWSIDLAMPALAAVVRVRWNSRLKTTAGTACPRTSNIDLNTNLGEFGGEVILRILKHELAHLVAHWRAGRRRIAAHGMEWRQACSDLGIPGEKSRHTLPFKSTPRRRNYAYQCPACDEVVLRVQKLPRYSACWACCKAHNRGKFVDRFQLKPIPLEKGVLLKALQQNSDTKNSTD